MIGFDTTGLIHELQAWVNDEGNLPVETEDGLPIFGIRKEEGKLILETYE